MMILINRYENKSGKDLYNKKLKDGVDPKIASFWVAFVKKVAKIWKSLIIKILRTLKYLANLSHYIWETLKEKVDKLFERIHRNPKV